MNLKISIKDTIFISFLIISIFIYKLILIIGDEPDFSRRTIWYLDTLKNFSFFFPFADNIDISRYCYWDNLAGPMKSNLDDLRLSFWFSFDPYLCNYDFKQVLYRTFINILVTSPIILIFLFRNQITDLLSDKNSQNINSRINILGCALIYPSIIYYIGNFSHEQIANVLVLIYFVFFNYSILVLLLSILIFFIDEGTGLLLLLFLIFNRLFILSLNLLKYRFLLLFLIFSLLIISYAGDLIFISIAEFISNANISLISIKFSSLLNEYYISQEMELREKYNIFLRPIFVFFGLMFLSPSQIKSIFLIIFTLISITYLIYLLINKKKGVNMYSKDSINFVSIIFFVFFIVFVLPTHSNAKYFIFIIPFSMMFIYQFIPLKNIFLFSLYSTILFVVNYSLFILY